MSSRSSCEEEADEKISPRFVIARPIVKQQRRQKNRTTETMTTETAEEEGPVCFQPRRFRLGPAKDRILLLGGTGERANLHRLVPDVSTGDYAVKKDYEKRLPSGGFAAVAETRRNGRRYYFMGGGYKNGDAKPSAKARMKAFGKDFRRLRDLPEPMVAGAAAALSSDDGAPLIVAGGLVKDVPSDAVHCWEPPAEGEAWRAGRWVDVAKMIRPRAAFPFLTVGADKAVALGGLSKSDTGRLASIDSLEMFHGGAERWEGLAHMPSPRHGHACAVAENLLVTCGGVSGAEEPSAACAALDLRSPAGWGVLSLPDMATGRVHHSAVPVRRGGAVAAVGGDGGEPGGAKHTVEVLDLRNLEWTNASCDDMPYFLGGAAFAY